jgi:hypothetical protein
MKNLNRNLRGHRVMIIATCMVVLQFLLQPGVCCAELQQRGLSPEEALQLGQRMYREGVLPSGGPMQVSLKDDLSVPGTVYACASCHLRSGFGSVNEGICTPAATASLLYSPLQVRYFRYGTRNAGYFRTPINRPAYNDSTLIRAIRSGVDPAGRTLEEVMPRFRLNDADMAIMIGYLKSLSKDPSPGISDGRITVATVVTDDVGEKEREAMLAPLARFVTARNNQSAYIRNLAGTGALRMAGNLMPPPSHEIKWSVWVLKGEPGSWRRQLDEYYRKEPVFALIGGISKGQWKPIHQFSEDNRIPCLFPETDFPVISSSDWYTLYLSKGYYQEGEAAARYLDNLAEKENGKFAVQIVRDSPEGRALAGAFQEVWQDLGHGVPETLYLKEGEEPAPAALRQLMRNGNHTAVVLWDGAAALAELELLAGEPNRPELILVSSRYLGKNLWSLKEELRGITYVTYPFRLQRPIQGSFPAPDPLEAVSGMATRGANQAAAIEAVFGNAVLDMKGAYYRDHLLDVIGSFEDIELPLYERLSFGPGQRFATKGCYIVQLSKGATPALLRKSDWITDSLQ